MVRRRVVEETVKIERGARLGARRRMLVGASGKVVSQKQLGAAVGVSGAQVSKYERGDDLLDAEKCHRFAQAVRCRFVDIFVPGRLELAEDAAIFQFRDDGPGLSAVSPDDELTDLMSEARAGLSAEHRLILRDVMLELLAAGETAPRVAP